MLEIENAENIEFEARLSLVDEFLDELEKEEYEYKVYKGDFLPLIDDVDSNNKNNHAFDYWTGFYSNRPNFK